jgi:hypothetical protein
MRSLAAVAVAMVLAVGCGGDGRSGPCVPRSGLYRARTVAESGNCGPVPDVIFNADNALPAGCTGVALPVDQCPGGDFDLTCPVEGSSRTFHETGKSTWAQDASVGSSTYYIEIRERSGTYVCGGVYSVSLSRP